MIEAQGMETTMRRWMQVCVILLCMVFFGSVSAGAQEIRRPKVFLAEHTYDFRQVMEGEVIQHSFSIFNKGNEELKILQVKAG
jgi:hypothetical protein